MAKDEKKITPAKLTRSLDARFMLTMNEEKQAIDQHFQAAPALAGSTIAGFRAQLRFFQELSDKMLAMEKRIAYLESVVDEGTGKILKAIEKLPDHTKPSKLAPT